jgi:hypothetical protein
MNVFAVRYTFELHFLHKATDPLYYMIAECLNATLTHECDAGKGLEVRRDRVATRPPTGKATGLTSRYS